RYLLGRPSPYDVDESPSSREETGKPLNLMPGERVRVKSVEEIRKTLDRNGKHKGLSFDPEMSGYCGGEFVVALRVEQIINEQTGEMMQMKRPCIMLEGVVCKAEYSDRRLFCPRAIPPYWREHWLERVPDGAKVERPKAALVPAEVGG